MKSQGKAIGVPKLGDGRGTWRLLCYGKVLNIALCIKSSLGDMDRTETRDSVEINVGSCGL